MRAETTSIPGLLHVELAVHTDGRGWFKESFQRANLDAAGLPAFEIVQHNVAFNAEVGVTRGIHGEPWDKYVSLAHGRAFAAIVDLRAGIGFGTVETFELHPGNAIFVPRGCGNSYQTLARDVVYTYLVNDYWSPDATYTHVNAYDPALGIEWPIGPEQALRSPKDMAHPPLSGVAPVVGAQTVVAQPADDPLVVARAADDPVVALSMVDPVAVARIPVDPTVV